MSHPSADPEPESPSEPDPQRDRSQRAWMPLAGLGMELAATTLGVMAVGYGVDRYRGQGDGFATAAGALIGFAYGMFRFIQKARRANA